MKHIDWSFKPNSALDDDLRELEEHHEPTEGKIPIVEWEPIEFTRPANCFGSRHAYDNEDEMEQWLADAIAEEEERQFLEGFAEQEYQKDLALGLIEVKPNPKGGLTQ